MPIPLRGDFETVELSPRGEELEGQRPGAPTIGAGCDLRRVDAHRGGEDRRRDASDRAGLGDEVQYPWSLRAHRRQGAGSNAAPDERAPRSPGSHGGGWPDRCRSWRGAWADCRPLPATFEAFHVVVSTQTMSRELRAMDYRKLSARSRHHAQATNAIEDFKKASRPAWRKSRGKRTSILALLKSGLPTRRASARRTKDHPTLGQARNASLSAERPAHRLDLYLRRDLSERGQGGRPDPAQVQHRSDAVASG